RGEGFDSAGETPKDPNPGNTPKKSNKPESEKGPRSVVDGRTRQAKTITDNRGARAKDRLLELAAEYVQLAADVLLTAGSLALKATAAVVMGMTTLAVMSGALTSGALVL